jgi:phage host-nuclease inhibitor protein Gam
MPRAAAATDAKSKARTAPLRSWDEVDGRLARIAALDLERGRLEAERQQRLLPVISAASRETAIVDAEMKPRLDLLEAEREALAVEVQTFAGEHKDEFGRPLENVLRSKNLPHGRVGWRLLPAAIKFVRPIADVLAALRRVGLKRAIVTEERPSKEILHTLYREGKITPPVEKEIGSRRLQSDEFILEAQALPDTGS